jgi:hypothetical protein
VPGYAEHIDAGVDLGGTPGRLRRIRVEADAMLARNNGDLRTMDCAGFVIGA